MLQIIENGGMCSFSECLTWGGISRNIDISECYESAYY